VVRESEPLCRASRRWLFVVRGNARFGVGRDSERSAENELKAARGPAERAVCRLDRRSNFGNQSAVRFLGGRSILIRQRCLDEGVPGGSHPGTRPRRTNPKRRLLESTFPPWRAWRARRCLRP